MNNQNRNELTLSGGRTTDGVVRVDNTVRRPIHKNGEFIHGVLRFLENSNYRYAPRLLGIDDQGREILSFIEGTVPIELGETSDKQLFDFMKIVRKLHDLSKSFTKSSVLVLCHGDLSPCNVVFQKGVPSAIIDWDGVYIGEPWEDLVYICWLWINLGSHEPRRDAVAIMKKALDSYGADKETRTNFTQKMVWRIDKAVREIEPLANQYERTRIWVEESKQWVANHSIEIERKIQNLNFDNIHIGRK